MLVYVLIKPTYPTSDVTTFAESALYTLYNFANNFKTKKVNGYYSKRSVGLIFHAFLP